ncbi:MAG: FAD-dependent oxidoreductase [Actinomycetota bacterium]
MTDRIVVVGASLAGHWAVEGVRRAGHEGELVLVGAEPHLPYDRPPLSKQVLTGDTEPDHTALRDASHYDSLDVELRLGAAATGLDLDTGRVIVGGDAVDFDGLVVATGSTARRLPFGHDLDGVHLLRTLDDAVAVRAAIEGGARVVVIGCGFIGAEVAAAARSQGCDVTIVEALEVPMARAVGTEMGAELAAMHERNGTTLRCGVGVEGVEGDGAVERVRLTDGVELDADLVVVGIGVTPATGWLEGSGLELRDGLVCDEALFAAPNVVGAGDVVRWPHPRYGTELRIEHWSNAMEQGMRAAENLVRGRDEAVPYDGVPFFWSDQYDHVVQLAGWPAGADEIEVMHRDGDGSLVALYRGGDRLLAALTVDRQRVLTRLRRQLAMDVSWEDGLVFVREQLA